MDMDQFNKIKEAKELVLSSLERAENSLESISKDLKMEPLLTLVCLKQLIVEGKVVRFAHDIFDCDYFKIKRENPKAKYMAKLTLKFKEELTDLLGAADEGLISRHRGWVDELHTRQIAWEKNSKKRGRK